MNHPNREIRSVARSIISVLNKNRWTKEEEEVFAIIEKIKNNYKVSEEMISVTDYGAGNPVAARSKEEMEIGSEKQEKVSEIVDVSASPEKWGKFMFKLIRDYRPNKCLELGTSLGISALYQLGALKVNSKGEIITIEGAKTLADIAQKSLSEMNSNKYEVKQGRFMEVLPPLLLNTKNIDFIFIDGHHDKTATKSYFELIYQSAAVKSIFIFDDINWSEGMKEVWKEISTDKKAKFIFDLGKWGIVIIDKNSNNEKAPKIVKKGI